MKFDVGAGESAIWTGTLVDADGVTAIPLASLTTLTLTLLNVRSRAVINSRDRQNVLNANNVTVHATSGLVTWSIQPADLVVASGAFADLQAVLEWTWNAGAKAGWHDFTLHVEAVPRP